MYIYVCIYVCMAVSPMYFWLTGLSFPTMTLKLSMPEWTPTASHACALASKKMSYLWNPTRWCSSGTRTSPTRALKCWTARRRSWSTRKTYALFSKDWNPIAHTYPFQVFIFPRIHTHTYIHTYIYTYIHTYIYCYQYMHTYVKYTHIHLYIHVHTYVHTYIHTRLNT